MPASDAGFRSSTGAQSISCVTADKNVLSSPASTNRERPTWSARARLANVRRRASGEAPNAGIRMGMVIPKAPELFAASAAAFPSAISVEEQSPYQ